MILDAQGRLLDAAVATGVRRFTPSDFSLDFTKTRPGDNRNMDLRRAFMQRVDRTPVAPPRCSTAPSPTCSPAARRFFCGGPKKVLYWGDANQAFDITTKDDVARYTARVAFDEAAPRVLRIAGGVVTPRSLAATATALRGKRFGLWRAGGIGRLGALVRVARTLTPRSDAPFPDWQAMRYLRDMSSGRGKLHPLDNDHYGALPWTTAKNVLQHAA